MIKFRIFVICINKKILPSDYPRTTRRPWPRPRLDDRTLYVLVIMRDGYWRCGGNRYDAAALHPDCYHANNIEQFVRWSDIFARIVLVLKSRYDLCININNLYNR